MAETTSIRALTQDADALRKLAYHLTGTTGERKTITDAISLVIDAARRSGLVDGLALVSGSPDLDQVRRDQPAHPADFGLCASRMPADGRACDLPAGHEGPHMFRRAMQAPVEWANVGPDDNA
jgi:hypothetical protein